MKVWLTVIVPVYNIAGYVRETLDSISRAVARLDASTLSLEGIGVEVICVDDGSTDGSGAVIEKWASEISQSNICISPLIIHQKNFGVSAARNKALSLATGEWIAFVDGDDLISEDLLLNCLNRLKDEKLELLHFDVVAFEDVSAVNAQMVKCLNVENFSRRISYDLAESSFFQFLYRRELIGDLLFPPYVMGEDRLFLAWILVRAKSVAHLDLGRYFYRTRMGSAINSPVSWRKFKDDVCHSVRRFVAFLTSKKRIDFLVYRHQIGLWINMLGRW